MKSKVDVQPAISEKSHHLIIIWVPEVHVTWSLPSSTTTGFHLLNNYTFWALPVGSQDVTWCPPPTMFATKVSKLKARIYFSKAREPGLSHLKPCKINFKIWVLCAPDLSCCSARIFSRENYFLAKQDQGVCVDGKGCGKMQFSGLVFQQVCVLMNLNHSAGKEAQKCSEGFLQRVQCPDWFGSPLYCCPWQSHLVGCVLSHRIAVWNEVDH